MIIFVSSTYADLRSTRAAIVHRIYCMDHTPSGMEAFGTSGNDPSTQIFRAIDQCDVFILIVPTRFGSHFPNTQISYTEAEYRYACRIGKRIVPVLLHEKYEDVDPGQESEPDLSPEGQEDARRLKEFREVIRSNCTLGNKPIMTKEDICNEIATELGRNNREPFATKMQKIRFFTRWANVWWAAIISAAYLLICFACQWPLVLKGMSDNQIRIYVVVVSSSIGVLASCFHCWLGSHCLNEECRSAKLWRHYFLALLITVPLACFLIWLGVLTKPTYSPLMGYMAPGVAAIVTGGLTHALLVRSWFLAASIIIGGSLCTYIGMTTADIAVTRGFFAVVATGVGSFAYGLMLSYLFSQTVAEFRRRQRMLLGFTKN